MPELKRNYDPENSILGLGGYFLGGKSKLSIKYDPDRDIFEQINEGLKASNKSGMSRSEKLEFRKMLAEDYLAARASEGLSDTEMKDLMDQAIGSINQGEGRARVGLQARNARRGIKQTSGLATSRQAKLTKGSQIARGRAQVAARRLDESTKRQALSGLLNIPVPDKKNLLGTILGGAARVGAAYLTGGTSEAVLAGAQTAASALSNPRRPAVDFNFDKDFYNDPLKEYRGYA